MSVDAIVLSLLAIADLGFLAHLRRRRREAVRDERMAQILANAVRKENIENPFVESPEPVEPTLIVEAAVLAKAS